MDKLYFITKKYRKLGGLQHEERGEGEETGRSPKVDLSYRCLFLLLCFWSNMMKNVIGVPIIYIYFFWNNDLEESNNMYIILNSISFQSIPYLSD